MADGGELIEGRFGGQIQEPGSAEMTPEQCVEQLAKTFEAQVLAVKLLEPHLETDPAAQHILAILQMEADGWMAGLDKKAIKAAAEKASERLTENAEFRVYNREQLHEAVVGPLIERIQEFKPGRGE